MTVCTTDPQSSLKAVVCLAGEDISGELGTMPRHNLNLFVSNRHPRPLLVDLTQIWAPNDEPKESSNVRLPRFHYKNRVSGCRALTYTPSNVLLVLPSCYLVLLFRLPLSYLYATNANHPQVPRSVRRPLM